MKLFSACSLLVLQCFLYADAFKMASCVTLFIALGTVQYLLKGRASGKAKFHEKKVPALLSIK